jgi:hypothetical protein
MRSFGLRSPLAPRSVSRFVSLVAVLWNSFALAAVAALMAGGCLALPARGAIVVAAAGTSAAGNPVAFRATLTILADELAIDLENVSPVATREPADLLASFYFDISRDGKRPRLDARSAGGQVVEVLRNAPDRPVIYTPPDAAGGKGTVVSGLGESDLLATKRGDLTWQFRQFDPAYEPLAGFGLGTVGNSDLSPANFDPKIVDGNDFAIFRGGDLEPKGNLAGRLLARELVRFRFGLPDGWTEADVGHRFTFGLGTSPDSVIVVVVSEPKSWQTALFGGMALAGYGVSRRGSQAARRAGQAAAAGSGSGSGPPAASASSSAATGLTCRPISRDTKTAM